MHIGILEFQKHGVAHITLAFFSMAHFKFATQLCQKTLGDASQYKDYVQCQNLELANMTPLLQHTPPTMWNTSFGFALTTSKVVSLLARISMCRTTLITQHMANLDRYQSHKARGVGS